MLFLLSSGFRLGTLTCRAILPSLFLMIVEQLSAYFHQNLSVDDTSVKIVMSSLHGSLDKKIELKLKESNCLVEQLSDIMVYLVIQACQLP